MKLSERLFRPRAGLPVLGLVMVLLLPAGVMGQETGAEATEPAVEDELDPEAVDAMRRATRFLAGAKSLRVKSESGFDVVQFSGRKLEFGKSGVVTIRRPDKLRVVTERRDGRRHGLVFDGKQITAYTPGENVYATVALSGDLDKALEYIDDQLEIPIPLADFLYSDSGDVFAGKVDSALHMGDAKIEGVECEHLALSNETVDYQVWIAKGSKPLPQRIVITYKHYPGQPQYWSSMEWEIDPEVSDSLFSFDPPKDADQIQFAPRRPAAATEEGSQ